MQSTTWYDHVGSCCWGKKRKVIYLKKKTHINAYMNTHLFCILFTVHFHSLGKVKASWQEEFQKMSYFLRHRLKDEWSKRSSARLCSHLGQLNRTYGPPKKWEVCIPVKKLYSAFNYSVNILFYSQMISDAVGGNSVCHPVKCSTMMALHPASFCGKHNPTSSSFAHALLSKHCRHLSGTSWNAAGCFNTDA